MTTLDQLVCDGRLRGGGVDAEECGHGVSETASDCGGEPSGDQLVEADAFAGGDDGEAAV